MNAVALLDQLDPDAIAARLAELDGERQALRVLLRASRARERRRPEATAGEARPEGDGPAVGAEGGAP